MRKRNSDNNVKLLYDLENHQLPSGQKFATHADVQLWVNEITGSRFWQEYADLPKSVKVLSHGDLDYSENKGTNELWLCNAHLRQAVVLHELAHFFPPADGHGPQFVCAYLGLLGEFLGLHYRTVYREAFLTHKIKF